jgi:hypothetical protein
MIRVIENFAPLLLQNDLEQLLTAQNFPWYYNANTTIGGKDVFHDKNTVDTPQFIHNFYTNKRVTSEHYKALLPLLYFLPSDISTFAEIVRCKANLTIPTGAETGTYNTPHTDIDINGCVSIIYYVHDADGDTVFFEEAPEKFQGTLTKTMSVTPKKGTVVIFDSRIIHAKSLQVKSPTRAVINFCLRTK